MQKKLLDTEFVHDTKNATDIADEWIDNWGTLVEIGKEIADELSSGKQPSLEGALDGWTRVGTLFSQAYQEILAKPSILYETQSSLLKGYTQIFEQTQKAWLGQPYESVITHEKKDKRFRHEQWSQNPSFDFIRQAYLLYSQHVYHLIYRLRGMDDKKIKQLSFYSRQFIDALSPSNFVLTNPEVLQETLNTKGENLVKGSMQVLNDLRQSEGTYSISMTDMNAFCVGKNLAMTPGKIVYQNNLMQLIQYNPSTVKVYKRPLLIIPPWINKYYILDLSQDNSFVKWAVEQGHSVFMISWVAPDSNYKDKGFSDYMLEGTVAALEAIKTLTGEPSVNAIGFCIGGTLLACTQAYLNHHKMPYIASATYLATLLDFAEPGEIEVFMDEAQISSIEQNMQTKGYLDGRDLALTFNMLRDNDLIWSFFVNNYLVGKQPFPFDLLFWNADSVHLPEKMHSEYLRNMYLNNLLATPGALKLADTAIDLTNISTPTYFLSTKEDHIAPWQSTYKGAQFFKGPVCFALGKSGHVAGIINPPSRNKYGFWYDNKGKKTLSSSPEDWLEQATYQEGSWWVHWQQWVHKLAAQKISARIPANGKKKLENAPGSYVKCKLEHLDAKAVNCE